MAQVERSAGQEKSNFKSRIFKFGLLFVAAGVLFESSAALAVGFAAMGGAWAAAK